MDHCILTPASRVPFCQSFKACPATSDRRKRTVARAAGKRESNVDALSRRVALTAALFGAFANQAIAAEDKDPVTPIYFGNGCFWGRQKDFVDTEKMLGRKDENISAVAGYAGGRGESGGQVCYYYGQKDTIYEDLGHAEVVQLDLTSNPEKAKQEMEMFATTYFNQFQKTRDGMQRLDPQDAGPAYRNVVGLPGGVNSPLFKILEEKNVYGMKLVPGEGNSKGSLKEGDQVGVVYVMDTTAAPFHLAEEYHQFHNAIGIPFGLDYTKKQKQMARRAGRIGPTGCPEIGGLFR